MSMATAKSTWAKASEYLTERLDTLKAKSRCPNLTIIADEAGLKPYRLYKLQKQPWVMKMGEQRMLMLVFKKYGVEFDPMLGIGGATNAAVVY